MLHLRLVAVLLSAENLLGTEMDARRRKGWRIASRVRGNLRQIDFLSEHMTYVMHDVGGTVFTNINALTPWPFLWYQSS